MRNGLRYKLITGGMCFLFLFSILIHVSIVSVSNPSGRIFSGVVYASSGVPVSEAIVTAYSSEGYGYTMTNSFGQYSIVEGLKTGDYVVTVIAEGYLYETIEDVPVTVGQETSNIDFYLHLSGGISGRVTDATSETPLQNIIVMASTTDGGMYGMSAMTDANGDYHIISNLATGTYNVTVLFPEGYIMKSVGGIVVTAGEEVEGVDLALERSGIISGRVTATPSGAPLENATVTATCGSYMGYAQTNATGYYRISSGLGSGTYNVFAMYEMSFDLTNVDVVAGVETSNIDFALTVSPPPPSGIISGKVTDLSSDPIQNVLVMAEGPAGVGQASTDENGEYVISKGLGTGIYTVCTSAVGYSPETVSGVSVTVNEVTSNVNFQLNSIPTEQSGRISGTVEGDADPIPEFQYPITVFLVVTLAAIVLTKLFKAKTKRVVYTRPIHST